LGWRCKRPLQVIKLGLKPTASRTNRLENLTDIVPTRGALHNSSSAGLVKTRRGAGRGTTRRHGLLRILARGGSDMGCLPAIRADAVPAPSIPGYRFATLTGLQPDITAFMLAHYLAIPCTVHGIWLPLHASLQPSLLLRDISPPRAPFAVTLHHAGLLPRDTLALHHTDLLGLVVPTIRHLPPDGTYHSARLVAGGWAGRCSAYLLCRLSGPATI